ncbi:MAG: ATP-binding cassette domain-containing protein [Muribaculaceae bacterium]|nr:ATP-binding cassette domain-containing protein [Muribaculaceae bacterium]
MNYIEVKDVVKDYDKHRALDHVSMDVPEGCIYGLLGPNGAGKTSLIRIINQITKADSGEIWLNGELLKPEDVRNMGYLPEERGLYKKMKIADQIMYLAQLKGMSRRDAETEMQAWLDRFELTEWRNKKVETLSKGMAQKVQFIATVIHRPKLLIFDEPFSGFDPVNAEILKREILRLRDNGATILFSTHNMGSVEEVCEQISLINHSRVVLQGDVNEVRHRFKKHIYAVNVRDGVVLPEPGMFTLKPDETHRPGDMSTYIRLNAGVNIKDVISCLNEKYELTGFHEILPSMNEVFIEAVNGKEKI